MRERKRWGTQRETEREGERGGWGPRRVAIAGNTNHEVILCFANRDSVEALLARKEREAKKEGQRKEMGHLREVARRLRQKVGAGGGERGNRKRSGERTTALHSSWTAFMCIGQ
jgi:hypothetical protein